MELGTLDTGARFESMRRQSRSAQVLRRHEDLRKQCEREMLLYEKAKRLTEAHCRQSQIQCLNRIHSLRRQHSSHQDTSSRAAAARRGYYTVCDVFPATATSLDFAAATTFPPPSGARGSVDASASLSSASSHCDSRNSSSSSSKPPTKARFLFRVLHRNGKELYIRDEDKARESRQLLNCASGSSDSAATAAGDVTVARERVSVTPRGLVAM